MAVGFGFLFSLSLIFLLLFTFLGPEIKHRQHSFFSIQGSILTKKEPGQYYLALVSILLSVFRDQQRKTGSLLSTLHELIFYQTS